MEVYLGVWVCFIYLNYVFAENLQGKSFREAEMDSLIVALQQEVWDAEEMPCLDKTMALLNGVKNNTLWASWVWDANQLPIGLLYGSYYQLGNFDQCMNPPWLDTHPHLRTQYCTANVTLTNTPPVRRTRNWDPYDTTANYINSESKHGIRFNSMNWGVCVPASCRAHSVAKLLRHMHHSRSQYAAVTAAPNVTVAHCQVAGASPKPLFDLFVVIAIFTVLMMTAVASTIYQSKANEKGNHAGSIESIVSNAFCLKRNYNTLVKNNPGEIQVMNGIRFLSSIFIIIVHQFDLLVSSPTLNPLTIDKEMDGLIGYAVLNLNVVVDTFLAMSGLLQVRSWMNCSGRDNLFLMLLRRYIRLLGPLAISIFCMTFLAQYITSGPFWPNLLNEEVAICNKNWKLSLLMLNTNFKEVCNIATWYVACDYQLAIQGTILYYIYRKDKKLGYIVFGAASVLSLLIPGLVTYWYRLPAVPFPNLSCLTSMSALRNTAHFDLIYTKSYVRANAYLIGVAMGYFMYIYKPSEHRRVISTKWSLIGTLSCVVLLQWLLGLAQFFSLREYNTFEVVLAASLSRAVWALAICCIIAFCEYGTVPIISDFLSLPMFRPLSRLSYGIYLIHISVIRTPAKFGLYTMIKDSLGALVISAVGSLVFWLLVEAPCMNLSNYFFLKKSPEAVPPKEDSSVTENYKSNGISITKIIEDDNVRDKAKML